jgi:hypothetical protein
MKTIKVLLSTLAATTLFTACLTAQRESGFVSLFDGQTLKGWKHIGGPTNGYAVKDGVIFCSTNGQNLFTEKAFRDFILRFEFKLEDGSNNGIGIRAPFWGNAAYLGMEIQVLDDAAADRGKWGKLRAEQYHGSIYDVVAAKCRALKPVGQWNSEEITADGRHIKVVVNGVTIVNANLNHITDPEIIHKHPGLFREQGHIGFLGHGRYVEFRRLRIKELSRAEQDNTAPAGFSPLFSGKDLSGWKGLLAEPNDNPIRRAALPPEFRAEAQQQADDNMRAHWKAQGGELVFDGQGHSVSTVKDYANFELVVDWKLPAHGDSGIYLRGAPQVQIWDPFTRPTKAGSAVGSGGFSHNQKNPSKPLKVADKPIGEWNRFRIVMAGEKAHVFLNGELVVNNTTLENYWDRSQPIFPSGPIELRSHGDAPWFKNIYIREIQTK